jgi:SAM-dependent methyltransferase
MSYQDAVDQIPCTGCNEKVKVTFGIPSFLNEEECEQYEQFLESNVDNKLKNFFKRWPVFYRTLSLIVAPVLLTGKMPKSFFDEVPKGSMKINIGSGSLRINPEVINVDIFPFTNVDLLASAHNLPFLDNSVDAISCDQVLEHLEYPWKAAQELIRITKPGGLIYIGVPFIYPLHPSPKDYSRWSLDGLKMLFYGCVVEESGVMMGPTSGMAVVLAMWFATIFSFGFTPVQVVLKYCFMLLLSPLRLLDFLYVRFCGSETTAGAVYIIMRKI